MYLDETNLAGSLQGVDFGGKANIGLLLTVRTTKGISYRHYH